MTDEAEDEPLTAALRQALDDAQACDEHVVARLTGWLRVDRLYREEARRNGIDEISDTEMPGLLN